MVDEDSAALIAEGEQRAIDEWNLEHKSLQELSDGLPTTEFMLQVMLRRGDLKRTQTAISHGNGMPMAVDVFQYARPIDENGVGLLRW